LSLVSVTRVKNLPYVSGRQVPTYIHRAGRTARYVSRGRGLLFLLPSELAMLEKFVFLVTFLFLVSFMFSVSRCPGFAD
jgi:superfamily II DNA/RNA helicase